MPFSSAAISFDAPTFVFSLREHQEFRTDTATEQTARHESQRAIPRKETKVGVFPLAPGDADLHQVRHKVFGRLGKLAARIL